MRERDRRGDLRGRIRVAQQRAQAIGDAEIAELPEQRGERGRQPLARLEERLQRLGRVSAERARRDLGAGPALQHHRDQALERLLFPCLRERERRGRADHPAERGEGPAPLGRARVRRLAQQELAHVVLLRERREQAHRGEARPRIARGGRALLDLLHHRVDGLGRPDRAEPLDPAEAIGGVVGLSQPHGDGDAEHLLELRHAGARLLLGRAADGGPLRLRRRGPGRDRGEGGHHERNAEQTHGRGRHYRAVAPGCRQRRAPAPRA